MTSVVLSRIYKAIASADQSYLFCVRLSISVVCSSLACPPISFETRFVSSMYSVGCAGKPIAVEDGSANPQFLDIIIMKCMLKLYEPTEDRPRWGFIFDEAVQELAVCVLSVRFKVQLHTSERLLEPAVILSSVCLRLASIFHREYELCELNPSNTFNTALYYYLLLLHSIQITLQNVC